MKKILLLVIGGIALVNIASADTFGTGANQFIIDFVNITGDASSANGTNIGATTTFSDPSNDYRIGRYEITNDQWDKFTNIYGTPAGSPSNAYGQDASWTGRNVPTNYVSWYEAAQFVNWLNTSTGHQAAYKFTGTPGQSDYTFAPWELGDVGYDVSNPYRNSNAYYFLPTEDEWIKAAYWNGQDIQAYASIDNSLPIAGVDANYDRVFSQAWDVGSGSEELNGTFDMMGNVFEWMETSVSGDYQFDSEHLLRGSSYSFVGYIASYDWHVGLPYGEHISVGLRIASIPEPCSLSLLTLGTLLLKRRKR